MPLSPERVPLSEDWFHHWFDEDYLALYPHRDDAEARAQAGALACCLPDGRVLDLACGAGRHLRWLAEAGQAFGVDLSMPLLARARADGLAVARADMRRVPFRDGAFAAVVSLFTSYGYFKERDDDRQVLAEVARLLSPRGVFVIDYLNLPRVLATLVAEEERTFPDGTRVRIRRSWDAERHRLEKCLEWEEDGVPRRVLESVRGYTPEELVADVEAAGLAVEDRWGDFDASAAGPTSPRCILFARRR